MEATIELGQNPPVLCRTVLINGLPLGTTRSDIFSLVLSGWGPLQEINLDADGEWATIVFEEAEAATEFVNWRRSAPLIMKSLHICISLAEDTEHQLAARAANRIMQCINAPLTICVRNLSRVTTTNSLREFFIQFGCQVRGDPILHCARGQRHLLYGFVSFVTVADKRIALTARGRRLHGRHIAVHSCPLQQ